MPAFAKFVAAKPRGSHAEAMALQKRRIQLTTELIEQSHRRLKAGLAATPQQSDHIDELVDAIAAGSIGVDAAVEHLLNPQPTSAPTGEEADQAATEDAAAAEETAAEEAAAEDEEEKIEPFIAAPTFYSGGAAWRGKRKEDGLTADQRQALRDAGTPSSEHQAYLASLGLPYRRALRPHDSRPETRFGGGFGMTERFADLPSFVDRPVRRERGPAAYSPGWHADSSRRSSPSAPFTTHARFSSKQALSSAAGGPGPGRPSDYLSRNSSMGVQVDSTMRSKPIFGFGTSSRSHGSGLTGSEAQKRDRPGPGSYNA